MFCWESFQKSFTAYLKDAGLAPSTIKFYLGDLQAFFHWYGLKHGGQADPADFTVSDIETYKYLLLQRGRSPATINRILQSLRKFGRFASAQRGLEVNHARDVRLSRVPTFSSPITLSAEDQQKLERFARGRQTRNGLRDFLILCLLLHSGIRAAELALLRWENFDFMQGSVNVAHHSGGNARIIPLPAQLQEDLKLFRDQTGAKSSEHLFKGRGLRPMSIRMIQQVITNLGREFGLPLNVKTLRNTHALSVWMRTGNLAYLAKRMGYKNIATALRHIVLPSLLEGTERETQPIISKES